MCRESKLPCLREKLTRWPSKGPWGRWFLITLNPFSHHSYRLTSELVVLVNLTGFSKQELGKVIPLSSLLQRQETLIQPLKPSCFRGSCSFSCNAFQPPVCRWLCTRVLQIHVQILALPLVSCTILYERAALIIWLSCHRVRGQGCEVSILVPPPQPLRFSSYYY